MLDIDQIVLAATVGFPARLVLPKAQAEEVGGLRMETIYEMLLRHEDVRLKPYRYRGKLQIGVGRNLDDSGITQDEAFSLLHGDVRRIRADLDKQLPWWIDEPISVRLVMQNMAFQLGIYGLLDFKKTLELVRRHKYAEAAVELLDSDLAKQTPARAGELAKILLDQSMH